MVLIAAAICTKGGKALLSRQFVEMTKSRIEGLLAAFPKLMSTGKAAQQQHTFVETEAVRYVYQPLEKLYVLLITTRASNILEDLETLRLFARVVPEYCRSMEEAEILDNAFSLLFAFDEIVALGYRENVNLAQIRTFVEMDSHEEKVYQAVRQTQEREAKIKMREKAKELQRQRVEASKRGFKSPGMNSGGFGPGSGFVPSPIVGDSASSGPNETPKPSYTPSVSKPSGPSKALKLGGKSKDADSFVDQLKSEGEHVSATSTTKSALASVSKGTAPNIPTQSVQLRIEEKLQLTAGRDGGLQNMEIHGIITLCITEEAFGRIRLHLENKDKRGIQLQTHPNVDKDLFKAKAQIALKTPAKPFPLNADVGVLKWRFQTQDENLIPLTINCWPSENGKGGCDVNIEYDLQDEALELQDVVIAIPIAAGAGSPTVSEYEGEYQYEPRKNLLLWRLPLVDASNKNGSLEFTCNGLPNDFFPINVSFTSSKSYADLKVVDVLTVDEGTPVKYSIDTVFFPEKYEIL